MEIIDSNSQVAKNLVTNLTWPACRVLTKELHGKHKHACWVYGVPRGGTHVALLLTALNDGYQVVEKPDVANLIVDDIVDSGRTRAKYKKLFPDKPFFSLIDKTDKKNQLKGWIHFPWEESVERDGEDVIVRLLEFIGEDPKREGLLDTPKRVMKAWKEMTAGYAQDPKKILSADFHGEGYDQMVCSPEISFYSTCEHHLLSFFGRAHVAYIPRRRVVGLSKMSRLVECFARRLQIQEKLTKQIADTMQDVLNPRGVGVVIRAKHLCMACRGAKQDTAEMVTCSLTGAFKHQAVKEEFFQHIYKK